VGNGRDRVDVLDTGEALSAWSWKTVDGAEALDETTGEDTGLEGDFLLLGDDLVFFE
jgi:hypothetical protein